MSFVVPGLHLLRALSYAMRACPTDEASSRFQHLALTGDKVIGADGERWHVGILPDDVDLEAMTVTRGSVVDLISSLDYARKFAKRHGQSFQAEIQPGKKKGEENAALVVIEFGDRLPIERELSIVNLGKLPKQWQAPVGADAPELAKAPAAMRSKHMVAAQSWHKSWEEDYGEFKMRGEGGDKPLRVDIVCNGEAVATAFLLPTVHAPAEILKEDDLFYKKGKSQSILDLDLSGDGKPKPQAQTIRIMVGENEIEIDASGLADFEELLKEGPCTHRDTGGCPQCTQAAVDQARADEAAEDDEEEEGDEGGVDSPAPGKRRKIAPKAKKAKKAKRRR